MDLFFDLFPAHEKCKTIVYNTLGDSCDEIQFVSFYSWARARAHFALLGRQNGKVCVYDREIEWVVHIIYKDKVARKYPNFISHQSKWIKLLVRCAVQWL